MGLTGLESIDEFIAINRRNYVGYCTQLAGVPGIRIAPYAAGERSNFQYVILEVDPAESPLTRDELVRVLHSDNILARRYFHPGCHRMEPYRTLFPNAGETLPHTEWLSERVLALPTGTAVGHHEIELVSSVVRSAIHNAGAIKECFAEAA